MASIQFKCKRDIRENDCKYFTDFIRFNQHRCLFESLDWRSLSTMQDLNGEMLVVAAAVACNFDGEWQRLFIVESEELRSGAFVEFDVNILVHIIVIE